MLCLIEIDIILISQDKFVFAGRSEEEILFTSGKLNIL